ncbi:MAG TPA: hypothetical protein VHW24_08710 [Bryobacteraceae bacterium]|jgi:hypothetical protein|nr:hypothetical protein [Bryobacteraceae bacterium]
MSQGAQPLTATQSISAVAELSDKALELMKPDLHPREFVRLLSEKALFPDAVRFVAHSLPKREAVWWGWVCARRASGSSPTPEVKAALNATELWISQPTEENRRAAQEASKTAGTGTAAGCAALAAFFSGGSLAPPHAPAVPPGEHLTAKVVAGAVIFAAVATEPQKAPEKFNSYLAQGLEVTVKIKLWEQN